MIWEKAGLVGSRAQWLISFSNAFHQHFWYIITGVVLVFSFFEFRVRAWPRYRRTVLFSLTILLNSAVFIWVLTLATAALVAVPLLLKAK